ncbi:BnaC09g39090D [Brassica napus]|uniref:BnaC09g39090D protein n=1 Tax=Brassica napus TaxID=3708 RepID=A0A078FLR2_BRANA|nr:BnaC09g39090D [Brassica napus]
MPRLYAQITIVSVPGFCLSVTWPEPDPDPEEEIQGEGSSAGTFSVYPKEGETWAIFKAHITSLSSYQNHEWSAHPDSHYKYKYAFVEILSEDDAHPRVPIGFLHKAKGFSGVFCRFNKEVDMSYIKRSCTMQFSHRVPSFKTTGIEAEGASRRGAYELDPAALPENIKEIDVPLHLLDESSPTVSNHEEEEIVHTRNVFTLLVKESLFKQAKSGHFAVEMMTCPGNMARFRRSRLFRRLSRIRVGEKRKRNEHGEDFDGLKFNDFEKLGKQTCLNTGHLTGSLRKGETWALFKNWDINWSSEPASHRSYEYEFVEILSDYADKAGVYVAFLHKAKGFASVFFRMGTGHARILPHSLYQFSHSVPSIRLTGTEARGVPKDAYELDQAALPKTIQEIMVPSENSQIYCLFCCLFLRVFV